MFFLKLLGGAVIEGPEGPLGGRVSQRRRLALLAVLALGRGRPVSRDRLLALFWPESESERARHSLADSLYQIRKTLGESAVLNAREELWLNAEVVCSDVGEFENALEQGEFKRAAEVYAGPLLEGFHLDDAPDFERWLDGERTRLARAYAKALKHLAEAAATRNDWARSVEWWRRLAAEDPYDTRVALRLMQALEASGNRAGALQHAAVHQRLLQEEFGIQPAPEVLALAERLRHEPAITVEPTPQRLSPAEPAPSVPETASVLTAEGSHALQPPRSAPPAAHRTRPAVLYALAALLLAAVLFGAIWRGSMRSDKPPPAAPEPSIAVLPLANHSTDPRDAALADGMTEELITMLAQTDGMRVIGSTSAFSFRNRQLDARSIADSLGVAHVLEGTLQKSGSRLRVRVRLVDARDGSARWAETYDRELQDVFLVQSDIARAVARELGVRMGAASRTPLRRPPTQNVAAYELYLRGNDPVRLRSDSAAGEGVEYLRQAVALDSTFAAAYAGLARTYWRLSLNDSLDMPVRGLLALAERAALKAIALDESLAEAYAVLGKVRIATNQFESAETEIKRAIEFNPARFDPRESLVQLYVWTGRPVEALAEARRGLEIDPLAPAANVELARALLVNGRCDEALAQLGKIAALQPPLLRAAPIAAQCYAQKQMWPEAIAVLRHQANRGDRRALALLGHMLARAGQREEALRIHATLLARWRRLERWRRGDSGAFEVAVVHAGLGDLDQAFAWFDRAIDDGSLTPAVPQIVIMEPTFQDLRRDPRFERLRERMGLHKR